MPASTVAKSAHGSWCAGLLAVASALGTSACHSPREAIANLDEIYSSRAGDRATYAKEVTDRGFFSRSGDDLQALVSSEPPKRDTEKLDDPVEFALDNLNRITDSKEGDLDPFERGRGVAVTAEIGMLDPSRVVRMRAYEANATLLYVMPLKSFRFDVKHVDESAVNLGIDALIVLASAPSAEWKTLLAARADEMVKGAAMLRDLRPEEYSLTRKLLLLATKCGRIVERADGPKELQQALADATVPLSGQVSFLAARPDPIGGHGTADPALEVRMAAGRLLVALDPIGATIELAKLYDREPSPLVRVALLKALSVSGMKAAGVHPTLRGPLVQELESEDASVEYWAKQALAKLLALDPEKTNVAEIRARWLALGEWDAAARS